MVRGWIGKTTDVGTSGALLASAEHRSPHALLYCLLFNGASLLMYLRRLVLAMTVSLFVPLVSSPPKHILFFYKCSRSISSGAGAIALL
jgi:hypothetical protein